jgi:hypothetical protein
MHAMSRRSTRAVRAVRLVGVAGVLVAVVAGCSVFGPDPLPTATTSALPRTTPPPSSPTPTPPPTPTPTPTLSDEEQAIADAEAALRAYYDVEDLIDSDAAAVDPAVFETVAMSDALTLLQLSLNAYTSNGWRSVGDTVITQVSVAQVDLTNDPAAFQVPIVELRRCYDVSGSRTFDADGNDVTNPNRQEQGVTLVGVFNPTYPDGPWLVGYAERQEGQTC